MAGRLPTTTEQSGDLQLTYQNVPYGTSMAEAVNSQLAELTDFVKVIHSYALAVPQ
jgi:hypothetical protein